MLMKNLSNTRVYTYKEFQEVLKSHKLPHSDPSIRKMENKSLIPFGRLPTANSNRSAKVYTGIMIKQAIRNLLDNIEGKVLKKKA